MCIMNILPLFTQGTIMDTYHNFTDLDTALVLVVLTIIAIAVYKLVHRFRKSSESAEDDDHECKYEAIKFRSQICRHGHTYSCQSHPQRLELQI